METLGWKGEEWLRREKEEERGRHEGELLEMEKIQRMEEREKKEIYIEEIKEELRNLEK